MQGALESSQTLSSSAKWESLQTEKWANMHTWLGRAAVGLPSRKTSELMAVPTSRHSQGAIPSVAGRCESSTCFHVYLGLLQSVEPVVSAEKKISIGNA